MARDSSRSIKALETCNKRFAKWGIPQAAEARRQYRELIVNTPDLAESISGAILFDETIRQRKAERVNDYETIVHLISHTTTAKGLQVTCRLDRRKYPTGRKVTDEEIEQVNLKRHKFHGDWNYTIYPSTH